MTFFMYHFIVNTILLSMSANATKYFGKINNEILVWGILGTSVVLSFLTGVLMLNPIGYNFGFALQFFVAIAIGFIMIRDWAALSSTLILCTLGGLIIGALVTTSVFFNATEMGLRATSIEVISDPTKADAYYHDSMKGKVRTVPLSTAIKLANKVLSKSTKSGMTLNSALEIQEGYVTIQEVNGTDYWILPLGYQGLFTQLKYGSIDAYVKVNAEDLNVVAELVVNNAEGEKFAQDVSLGAFFGTNIKRVFVTEHPTKVVSQYKFVVDEQWNPYVAVYTVKPDVGFASYVSESVFLYDFKSNEFTEYRSHKDMPEWVDVFQDLNTSMDIVNDWGEYRKGYFATWGSTFGTKLTTYNNGADMFFVNTSEGRAWFSGMTSISTSNSSLTHYTFINTKTGKITLIEAEGISDENGVVDAVQSSLGAEAVRWTATMPILYRSGDKSKKIWILPVIDQTSKLVKRFAVVDSENLSNVSIETTLESALRSFSRLGSFKSNITESKDNINISGIIESFNLVNRNDSIVAYILVDSSDLIVECHTAKNPQCLVMSQGQEIDIKTYEFDTEQVRVIEVIQGGNKR